MGERVKNSLWSVFVFLLPWQTVWIVREVFVAGEKWQYATVGVYASDIALLLFAALVFSRAPRAVWREMFRNVFVRILLALFVWTLLSSLWAIRGDMAMLSVWRMALLLLAYISVRYGDVSLRRTTVIFLTSMAIHAALALLQWTGQGVCPSSLLGIAEHEVWRPGASVLKTENGRFLRAYGGLEHPNVLGGALAIAVLFGVWLSSVAKRFCARVGFLGMTAVLSFALVLTFSRSAWIACGMGMALFVSGVAGPKSDKKNTPRYAGAVFLALLSFFVGLFLLYDVASSRFSEETLAREGSLSDRAAYMRQAFVAIGEYPIFGVGGGNFTAFTHTRFHDEGNFVGDFQPVHMVPVLVFAELGIVGFVLFVLLFGTALVCARREKNIFAGAILFALLPLLVLDHWLWSGHFGAVFLGFVLGVIALFSASSKRESG